MDESDFIFLARSRKAGKSWKTIETHLRISFPSQLNDQGKKKIEKNDLKIKSWRK